MRWFHVSAVYNLDIAFMPDKKFLTFPYISSKHFNTFPTQNELKAEVKLKIPQAHLPTMQILSINEMSQSDFETFYNL
jgi:hypothetical protein